MLRDYVRSLEEEGRLVRVRRRVSTNCEISGILKALDGRPVLFEQVEGYSLRVIGNLFSSRELVASALRITPHDLTGKMLGAIEHPSTPRLSDAATFLDRTSPDLSPLPILTHCVGDGGPYLSSSVVVAQDPEFGGNLSFHRMMVLDEKRLAVRIVPRHLDQFIRRAGGELNVAVCVGGSAAFLLAGATSVDIGIDELTIANTLEALSVHPSPIYGIPVPADAEIVIEGRITGQLVPEGRFVDLTQTHDIIRMQPVMEVQRVSYRSDAYYQAILPGAFEHKILMGLPREPTIYREVSKVCRCLDVHLTLGGCSWLNAVVVINKQDEEDGKRAIDAAFRGHSSLKFVVIVDADIDPRNATDVEWAMATRVQADRALVVKPNEVGSSLDPSADPVTRKTAKWGVDATRPLEVKGKSFDRVPFPEVKVEDYL